MNDNEYKYLSGLWELNQVWKVYEEGRLNEDEYNKLYDEINDELDVVWRRLDWADTFPELNCLDMLNPLDTFPTKEELEKFMVLI